MTDDLPECSYPTCRRDARWSVCDLQGDDLQPIVRWFACGRHLHGVLTQGGWEADYVRVYDLSEPVGAS